MRAVVLALLLASGGLGRASGPLPPLPPLDPFCTLYRLVNLAEGCLFGQPRIVETTTAAPKFTLSHDVGQASFTEALICGSLACGYWGVGWRLHGSGLSVDGECAIYSSIESAGTFTRPLHGTPGLCQLRHDPSDADLRSPGYWKLVNFYLASGGAGVNAASYLVGVRPELFKLTVTPSDPVDGRPAGAMYAVRHGADPTRAQCISPVRWLPDRVVPDCVVLDKAGQLFSAFLPNARWNVHTFHGGPPGAGARIRTAPTPWKTETATIADQDVDLGVLRVPRPQIVVSVELLGGDDLLFVGETGTVRVTVATTSEGVDGTIDGITFNPAPRTVVRLSRPLNGGFAELLGDASPLPEQPGFSMGPGEVRVFETPIRGTGQGTVNLVVSLFGQSAFFDRRDVTVTRPIQIIPTSTPTTTIPPPAQACGHEILTFVGQLSTGSALQVKSAAGIAPGDELVVDPCTENAEQITVANVTGNTLSVSPALAKIHFTDEPVIRADPNGSLLRAAAQAGDTALDVLDTSAFTLGDAIVIDPRSSIEERRVVTGFGSILIDAPLAHAHGIGTAVVRETGLTTTTTSPPGSVTTTTTGPPGSVTTTTTSTPGTVTTTSLPDSGCTLAATLDSVRCRLAALTTEASRLAVGGPRTQLLAKVNAAAAAVDKAQGLLAGGKKKAAKAAVRKASKAIAAFGKRLRAKKTAQALSGDLRSRLEGPLPALRADVKTLSKNPVP